MENFRGNQKKPALPITIAMSLINSKRIRGKQGEKRISVCVTRCARKMPGRGVFSTKKVAWKNCGEKGPGQQQNKKKGGGKKKREYGPC